MSVRDLCAAAESFLLPATITIMVLSLFAVVVARRAVRNRVDGQAAFLVCFASLGTVAGMISGYSRESIAGSLLTGLLGLIAGALAFLLGKDGLKEWRGIIPYAIIVLVFGALIGLALGGIDRKQWDGYERDYQKRMLEYEKVDLEVERLQKLREYGLFVPPAPLPSATSGGGR